jgi:hypothetical protein
MDDELTRFLAEGKTARARQVASERSRRGTGGRRSPSFLTLLLFLAFSVAIAGGNVLTREAGSLFRHAAILNRAAEHARPALDAASVDPHRRDRRTARMRGNG